MFQRNKKHIEVNLFPIDSINQFEMRKKLERTEEYGFYNIVFCNINESVFAPLYCQDNGRPNAPVNSMLSAFIMKEQKRWTYRELFKQLDFNLAIRAAIGVFDYGKLPFNQATLFNFQNRLYGYLEETGENLVEAAFSSLTQEQRIKYGIQTDIARLDTFMLNSNIYHYGRLQLLLEVILRFYRILNKKDKYQFKVRYLSYTTQKAKDYIYDLTRSDFPHEWDKITSVYSWLKENVVAAYRDSKECQNFLRVYEEHFSVSESGELMIKPSQDIKSGSLQSPDDPEATYRTKRDESYHGYSGLVVETCNPDNRLNLITDVSVYPNNVDDSEILADRTGSICASMPGLKEIHQDGGFGSETNDKIFDDKKIVCVQTAIKGREAKVEIDVTQDEPSGTYAAHCQHGQSVLAEPTGKRYKAVFSQETCASCPFLADCPTKQQKKGRVFYFDREYYLRKKRHKQYQTIPKERRKLRSNVEATVKEIVPDTKSHKVKVRGRFKVGLFVLFSAFAVNFGRIFRYFSEDPVAFSSFLQRLRLKWLKRLIFYFCEAILDNLNYFSAKSACRYRTYA